MAPAVGGCAEEGRLSLIHRKRSPVKLVTTIGQRLARFRQINTRNAVTHRDALEFPDGQVVLLTRLREGQRATVLQLPATAHPAVAKEPPRSEDRGSWLLA